MLQLLSSLGKTLRIMSYNRVGFAGLLAVLAIVLISYIGPSLVELDKETKVDHRYEKPSSEFWFGTDDHGRDIYSQIIHGGKDVLKVAFIAGLLSTFIAVAFGTLAGFRRRLDRYDNFVGYRYLSDDSTIAALAGTCVTSQAQQCSIIRPSTWRTRMAGTPTCCSFPSALTQRA